MACQIDAKVIARQAEGIEKAKGGKAGFFAAYVAFYCPIFRGVDHSSFCRIVETRQALMRVSLQRNEPARTINLQRRLRLTSLDVLLFRRTHPARARRQYSKRSRTASHTSSTRATRLPSASRSRCRPSCERVYFASELGHIGCVARMYDEHLLLLCAECM